MADDETYTTNMDLRTGSVHVSLTDAEIIEWMKGDIVRVGLIAELIRMIDEHGAQQVCIALGIASSVDLWRKAHPERWTADLAKAVSEAARG